MGWGTRDIGEYFEPDATVDESDQRVHTNVSNLRHVFGGAAGPRQKGYVIQPGGRYQLDPTVIDVDLWQRRRAFRDATIASGTRRRDLLQTACDLYTAQLAAGKDYEWVEPHREAARRWATEAHLRLADELLATDPQAASDLLDKAIGLDWYNEELYRRAMHCPFRTRRVTRRVASGLSPTVTDAAGTAQGPILGAARSRRAQSVTRRRSS